MTEPKEPVRPPDQVAYLESIRGGRPRRIQIRLGVEVQTGDGATESGTTVNLGVGGMFVATSRIYDVGAPLKFRISGVLPEGLLEVTGQVAWRLPGTGIGIRFDELPEIAKESLTNLVKADAPKK